MKKTCIQIIFLIVLITGFQTQSNQSTHPNKISSLTERSSSETASLSVQPTCDSLYSAYYNKYKEFADKYGEAKNINISDAMNNISYLSGVCVVDLIDFNKDNIKDLLLIYSNGKLTGKNYVKWVIPKAETYEIEIWTYKDNKMAQLLHEPNVGCFSSYRTEYWDDSNCIATVYENDIGFPVIQLYGESIGSYSYTNLYYSEGKLVKDKLSFNRKIFTLNGSTTSKDIWDKNVSTYNKILICAYLSSPSLSTPVFLEDCNFSYNSTLIQTNKVVGQLVDSRSSEFISVNKKYISLYLHELDNFIQESLDPDYYYNPYEYSLYDIDDNGTPELIVLTGTCEADFLYKVYTVENGKLIFCGEISGSHVNLYTNGKSGIVKYSAHMDAYSISKIILDGVKLKEKVIANGESINKGDEYPKLEKFGLGDYNKYIWQCHVMTPYLLYSYNVME
jgi:hypothetical protein